MPSLVSVYLGVALLCTAQASDGESGEGVVTLSVGIAYQGERFVSDEDVSKGGFVYYGLKYGRAERYQESILNSDFSYLTEASWSRKTPVCPQLIPAVSARRNLSVSEDCLFLDIYVPNVPTNQNSIPVMVYFYGGGFQTGDKEINIPTNLVPAINVIAVNINYRVSSFGFLSTEDDAAKGNYGIGDMKLAVEWTRLHIGKFGGDPSQITIWGFSAGGRAVSTLMLDPAIRGTVKGAIAFSGSVLSHRPNTKSPRILAMELAGRAGCMNNLPTTEVVQCLKKLTVQQILEATPPIDHRGNRAIIYAFPQVIGGTHLPEPYDQILSSNRSSKRQATFVTGFLREDAASFLEGMYPDLFGLNLSLTCAAAKDNVAKYLIPILPCSAEDHTPIEKVMDYYGFRETDSAAVLLQKFIKVASDASYGNAPIREARLYANRSFSANVPNYLFRTSYDSGHLGLGAYHGMDVAYIYDAKPRNLPRNVLLTQSLREMLRQIAHNGKLPFSPVGSAGSYIEIGQSGELQQGQENLYDLADFWEVLQGTACAQPVGSHGSVTKFTPITLPVLFWCSIRSFASHS